MWLSHPPKSRYKHVNNSAVNTIPAPFLAFLHLLQQPLFLGQVPAPSEGPCSCTLTMQYTRCLVSCRCTTEDGSATAMNGLIETLTGVLGSSVWHMAGCKWRPAMGTGSRHSIRAKVESRMHLACSQAGSTMKMAASASGGQSRVQWVRLTV